MQEVVLVIHLLLAVTIIGLVLLQRSSGGGLGIGGGSGGLGDFASARSTANALSKATTICAFLFFATSLILGFMAKDARVNKGLLDNYANGTSAPAAAAPVLPTAPAADGTQAPANAAAPAAPAPAPATPSTPEPPVSTQ